jgi:hypothetical protein
MVQDAATLGRELQADEAPVGAVSVAANESRPFGPVHELDRAVMTEQQVLGDLPDRRVVGPTMAPHCEQELVLLAREPSRHRLALAPVQEAPEAGPELQQLPVLLVVKGTGRVRVAVG